MRGLGGLLVGQCHFGITLESWLESWIKSVVEQFGSFGVGFLMLVENVFPPIPSELVMPWAGYAVSQELVTLPGILIAGSIGSFLGALAWYLAARWLGENRLHRWVHRHGWWLTVNQNDLDRMNKWFHHWGSFAVLICRLIPGLRTLISIPAGFARMPADKFCSLTAVGTVIWTASLAMLGKWLGANYNSLAGPLGWVSKGVIAGLFIWYLYRVITQVHRRHGKTASTR